MIKSVLELVKRKQHDTRAEKVRLNIIFKMA